MIAPKVSLPIDSRSWPILCVTACVVLSIGASYKRGWVDHPIWPVYEAKARAPLTPIPLQPEHESHVTNLDLRLTVPLIAYSLGLERRGFDRLYLACGFLTLLLAYYWMAKQSGDRLTATALCLACAAMSSGSQGLIGSPFYDPVAILLGVACLWRMPFVLLVPIGLVAAFVDERAALMLPAVLLSQWWARLEPPTAPVLPVRVGARVAAAGVVLLLLVWAARGWLRVEYGLQEPPQDADVGPATLSKTLPYLQLFSFSGMELMWVPVAIALYSQWQRSRVAATLLATAVIGPVLASFIVYDVLRSMAFGLPAIVLCAGLVPPKVGTVTRRSLFAAVAIGNLLIWDIGFYGSLLIGLPAPVAWWLSS